MQMLAMCQERKKQKSSLTLTRKERIAACVAELQSAGFVRLALGASVVIFSGTVDPAQRPMAVGAFEKPFQGIEFRAYEDFSGGTLAKDAYLRQRADIDSKLASAKAEQEAQEQLLSELTVFPAGNRCSRPPCSWCIGSSIRQNCGRGSVSDGSCRI